MTPAIKTLKAHVYCDSFGRTVNNETTMRWEYFYRHGKSAESYAARVQKLIDEHKLALKIVDSGDHWAPFNGGASTKKSSHFYVTVKEIRA